MSSPVERLEAWCNQRSEWVNQNWPGVGMQTDKARQGRSVIDAYRKIIARYRYCQERNGKGAVGANVAEDELCTVLFLLADALNPEQEPQK